MEQKRRVCAVLVFVLLFACSCLKHDDDDQFHAKSYIRGLQKLDNDMVEILDEKAANPAYKNQGMCTELPQIISNQINKHNVKADFLPHLSKEDNVHFATYFQGHFSHNTSIMGDVAFETNSKIEFQKVTTDGMVLFENPVDSDYLYIGFGDIEESLDEPGETILYKTLFTTKKTHVKKMGRWELDFEIKDDFAFCFYCNNDLLPPQVCKIRFEVKTWGAKNNIRYKSKVYKATIESNDYMVVRSIMYGGPAPDKSLGMMFMLSLYLLVPYATIITTLTYHAEKNAKSGNQRSMISNVGYFIYNSFMMSYFIYVYLFTGVLCVDIGRDVLLFLLFIFAVCGILMAIIIFPIVVHGKPRGTSDFDTEPTSMTIYIVFYIVSLPAVMIAFGHILLYYIYMSPTIYFILGCINLVPVVCNVFGKSRIHDLCSCVLINGIFYAILPFTAFGPSLWISGFTFIWFATFVLFQIIISVIIRLQELQGSRFFLPAKYRSHVYDKFLKSLDDPSMTEAEQCCVCLNSLYDAELEYKDTTSSSYKYREYSSDVCICLECNHKYHPYCLFHRIRTQDPLNPKCPKCGIIIPEDGFDD